MAGIEVRIGADSSELQKAIKDANKSVGSFKQELRDGVTSAAKLTAGVIAAGGAIGTHLVAQSIAAAKETANLSRVAGVSASQFQKYAFAAKSVGVEQDKLSDILKDVNDKVGDFLTTGAGGMTDFFEQIAPKVGVTAEQFRNLSGPQALQLYVDSLQKANLSQAEMTFHMEALASDATALLPLLQDGGAALQEQARQAEALGLALSDIDIAQMQQAQASMSQISNIFNAFVDNLAARFAPVITAVSKALIQTAEDAGGVKNASADAFNGMIDAAAFGVDAVEGVKRTFEILGKAIAAAALKGKADMIGLASGIVDGPIIAVNKLIDAFNQIADFAGFDEVENVSLSFADNLRQSAADAQAAWEIAVNDIHETIMRPMPSAQFKQYVAEAQEAGRQAAAALIDIPAAQQPEGEGGPYAKDKEAAEAHKKALADRLERIMQANQTEKEIADQKLKEELEQIQLASEMKMLTEDQISQAKVSAHQTHQQALTDITARQEKARTAVEQAEAQARRQMMGTALSDISALMNSESKKMFKIGKAAAISNTVMTTIESAQNAFNAFSWIPVVGPALGAAAAAAAAAAGFARVNAIKSQSFGSSSGAGAAAGGGGTGGASTGAGQAAAGGGAGGGDGPLQVSLSGLDRNRNYSGEEVSDLFELLSDEAGDRGLQLAIAR